MKVFHILHSILPTRHRFTKSSEEPGLTATGLAIIDSCPAIIQSGQNHLQPNTLIQEFAYLSAMSLFTETCRRQIRTAVATVSPADIPDEIIQETGEGLGNLLGRILEARLRVERFINLLEG